jgi:hypothetical protein
MGGGDLNSMPWLSYVQLCGREVHLEILSLNMGAITVKRVGTSECPPVSRSYVTLLLLLRTRLSNSHIKNYKQGVHVLSLYSNTLLRAIGGSSKGAIRCVHPLYKIVDQWIFLHAAKDRTGGLSHP